MDLLRKAFVFLVLVCVLFLGACGGSSSSYKNSLTFGHHRPTPRPRHGSLGQCGAPQAASSTL